MKRILLVCFVGACAFAGGWLANSIGLGLLPRSAAQQQPAVVLPAPPSDILKLGDRFELVAQRVAPAVVAVEAARAGTKSRPVEEAGSGVIVRFPGRSGFYVLTNNHVIAQARPEQITINLADARLLHPVQVWTDPESDVAVMRLDGVADLPFAPLGNSDQARVGQWVLAIGCPFGLNQTVTHGIISARQRGQISLGSTIRIKDFLQSDAAINPGSSGGPLVNLEGEVIGINTAIASPNGSSSGVAFSIPINLVRHVTGQLLEKGRVSRGYLGVQVAASFEPSDALKLGLQRAEGALVEIVYPGTPAAAAGLRANDVLLQLDGQPIRNENHLINSISDLPVGQRIRLQVWRDRRFLTIEAVVGDWSVAAPRFRNGQ